ncbi:MAG: FG-GAP repeat protein [Polyangiaceae bacterium]|nr:FG-GAP repeat protein [Polyangiaceae bacterium]
MAPELRLALLQARQAEASDAHRILTTPDGLRASVPETHLRARFDEQGAELTSDQDAKVQARLSLTSLGRSGGARQRVKAAKPVASKHTVTWERPVGGARVQESWQAGPLGLEHRVLVRQRPSGEGTVELEVSVAGLKAEEDGEDVKLTSANGSLLMQAYFVRDARGKLLPGRMKVSGGSVVYTYEDTEAAYPVEVDPLVFTQQAKLLAADKADLDYFGWSVALSSDGNTALIGVFGEDDGATLGNGAAYVFIQTAGVWTQQQKLLAADKANSDRFGYSVALSSDGNTALIGASEESDGDTGFNGAAYVFTRTAGVWTQQQKILAADKATFNYFGYSVALSFDGNTALIGAIWGDDGPSDIGAAYVFTRTAGVWTQQQKILAADKATFN